MSALTAATLRFENASFERLPASLQMIWIGLLAGAGTVASAAFACAAPFAAVAMLAGATLPLRKAIAVTAALWLGNQIVGFGLLGYPWDGETLTWGAIIGVASLAAAFAAHRAATVTAQWPSLLHLCALFVAAFATYQAGLLFGSAIVAAHGGLATDIMAYVAFINLVWTIGLGAAYASLQMLAASTALARTHRQA